MCVTVAPGDCGFALRRTLLAAWRSVVLLVGGVGIAEIKGIRNLQEGRHDLV
ncbi:MAG: hypothetical protein M3071_12690 [Actinomycetota bacterium]|nr:hypothetical protein [Actinomycetota bacterium]